MHVPEYTIIDLAKLADVTPRTIRFYIAQGLLPSPEAAGPRTTYTDEHLERLRLIKKMQAAHLPLAEIRAQLRSMGAQDVAEMITPSEPARVSESAVEYIRGVLGTGPAPAAAPAARSVAPPPPPQTSQPAQEPDRSQWDRVEITPDIEIHIRRPMTRTDNKRVLRLIEYARQLFREE
jgi:DNA-binding transcriptional MerR regulator